MSKDAEIVPVQGYYPTIGIECHVQLKTATKLFSSVSNEARDAAPNTLVNHVCFGLPGALPVLNEHAVTLAAKAAFALGTTPQPYSKFDRKHYFYPDLPKGYQITQFDEPIILGGELRVILEDGSEKDIAITRAHMEEDAGKSTHPIGADYSLVDLNRAGTPLLEIVSEPVIHTSAEAKAYAKELWLRMKYAGVSDVDLYHGNMRFDVNVSVSKDPSVLGTRTETKNLNSFKSVERAVDYEIARQISVLEKGGVIVQETRGWLDDQQKTVSQRSKENAHDYRYFPDPDIPPLQLSDDYIAAVKATLPIMPDAWRKKLKSRGIGTLQIEALLETQVEFSTDFLSLLIECPEARCSVYANWVLNIEIPLRRTMLSEDNILEISSETRARIFNAVADLSEADALNSNNVKKIIEELLAAKEACPDIAAYAESQGYIQLTDSNALAEMVRTAIADNPKPALDVQQGEMKAIGFLVGQVMKMSNGQANPVEVQKLIRSELGI